MKNSLFISILFWLSVSLVNGQEFSFKMIFSDAIGNKDTLTFGYDPEATDSIDAEFNESNIISSGLDAVFDVRITNEWKSRAYYYKTSGNFHLKKQIVKKNCPGYSKPIGIDIKCVNWPVTATWDSSLFVNQNCRYGSLFTDMNEGGWWDVGGPSDLPGYQSLLTSNKITFSKNYYEDQFRDYPVSDGGYINQANDTISTFWVVLGDKSVFGNTVAPAQNFAPVGAEWYYSEGFAFSGDIDYLMIKSVKDTIIKDKDCRKLDCDWVNCNLSKAQYVIFSSDSLFHFNSNLDTFQLIANFGASKGDTWNIISKDWDETIDTITVVVDSTGTVLINGNSLKLLYVNYNVKDYDLEGTVIQNYSYSSKIIERIGDIHYLFNFPVYLGLQCDANYSLGLRCYQDTVLGFYSTGIADSCTYVYKWTDAAAINQNNRIKVYPNPVTQELQIENHTGKKLSLKIFDINGRTIIEQPLNDVKSTINLNASPGVYSVLITGEMGEKMLERKIVKL